MYLVLEGGRKCTNIVLGMGSKIRSDAAKSGNITHLLVLMPVREEYIQPVYNRI